MSIENEVFSWLKQRGLWTQTLGSNGSIIVGPGDDAAVLARPQGDVVVSTDLLTDDVDFLLKEAKPELVGRKALGVNLSDLAAMGATPWGFTVSIAVDKHWTKPVYENLSCIEYLKRFCEGMLALADEFHCPLIGGDTNSFNGPMVISITIFGTIPHNSQGQKSYFPWTRNAAQVGDVILVTGALGGSILERQFTFTPRVNEALYLRQNYDIHAAMDISDGLSLDLSRMMDASGTGAKIDLNSIPIHQDTKKLKDDKSPLQHALSDGEDFELILVTSPLIANKIFNDETFRQFGTKLTQIGTVIDDSGLWTSTGEAILPTGWNH